MTTPTQVVDAAADDLNLLALPQHRTWRYVEPQALRMDLGTWLAVFPASIDHRLIATPSVYDDSQELIVWWAVPAFEPAESNLYSDVDAASALAVVETITDRIRTWAEGMPTLTGLWAVLSSSRFSLDRQQMAWLAELRLRVEEFE